jgi:hypothetical protein
MTYTHFAQTIVVDEGRRYWVRGQLAGAPGTLAYVAAFPRARDGVTPSGTEWYFGGPMDPYPGGPEFDGWAEVGGPIVTPPGTRFLTVHVQVAVQPGAAFRGLFDQVGVYEETAPDRWDIEDDAYRGSRDYPVVYIANRRYEHLTRSASWQLGRSWWFATQRRAPPA